MQGAIKVVASVKHGIEQSTQAAESAASQAFAELRKAVDLRERTMLEVILLKDKLFTDGACEGRRNVYPSTLHEQIAALIAYIGRLSNAVLLGVSTVSTVETMGP